MRKEQGNMLAVFTGLVLLVLIFFPLTYQLLQSEAKQSVNHLKSTLAFHLAESAVAKGVATLTESRKNWTDAVAGVPLVGYNDDQEFTDIRGGRYKVKITSSSTPGHVVIIGKGRDSSSQEIRVIEAEYSGADPDGPALIYNRPQFGMGLIRVHWGSVKSYSGTLRYYKEFMYPRLYSVGGVQYRDENPSPPNSDNISYWAYQTDMGAAPVPDLAYYKQKAMDSVVASSSTTGEIRRSNGAPTVRNPPNSGLFQATLNPGVSFVLDKFASLPEGPGNFYEFRCSTCVLYFELSNSLSTFAYIRRAFLDVEAVIVPQGELDFANSTTTYHTFGATIPVTAPSQYQTNWSILWGYPTGQSYWASNFAAPFSNADHCCYNIDNLQLHGYYYNGGYALVDTGGARFLGVMHVGDGTTVSMSGDWLYYDPNVLQNVVWKKTTLHMLSWKESRRPW